MNTTRSKMLIQTADFAACNWSMRFARQVWLRRAPPPFRQEPTKI